MFADLFFLGFSGGIYIVPLYAFMQHFAPESHRARIIGANNIFNALFMVGSAIFSFFFFSKMALPQMFALVGVLNVLVGAWVFFSLKKHDRLINTI